MVLHAQSETTVVERQVNPLLKTILVVEDDEDLGELILEVLEREEFQNKTRCHVVLAIDGREALKVMDIIKPNLFLLDYYLPRMNGLDLYDRLHAMDGLQEVPAIFISANPPMREIEKRKLIGMRKPFNLRELVHVVERLLA
jgi:CheY-like chemotaxis protein